MSTTGQHPCPPPRHRMAVMVWLAIYPTITLLLALGGAAIAEWPLPLRTFALTVVAVPLMVFVLLPRLQRCSPRGSPDDRPKPI